MIWGLFCMFGKSKASVAQGHFERAGSAATLEKLKPCVNEDMAFFRLEGKDLNVYLSMRR
ncbi:hypothetical protein [Roseibium sp.]|uniref:hypothetical protein n=1 Tax=Roseibium sp. TaxID=1936156 RepID=UPI003A97C2A4